MTDSATTRFPKRERRQATFANMSRGDEIDEMFNGADANTSTASNAANETNTNTRQRTSRRPRSRARSNGGDEGGNNSDAAASGNGKRARTAGYGAAAMRVQQEGHHMHGNELYCICRRPYDPRMFMIGCDRCDGWFHAACVNISINEAKKMESYTCPNCKKPSSGAGGGSSSALNTIPNSSLSRGAGVAGASSSAAAAATASTAAAGASNTAATGAGTSSTTKKRKRKAASSTNAQGNSVRSSSNSNNFGSGAGTGGYGRPNNEVASWSLRFSDICGTDYFPEHAHGPVSKAHNDDAVFMTSDEEETGDERLQKSIKKMSKRSLFVDLDKDSKDGDASISDFNFEALHADFDSLSASERDDLIVEHLMRTSVSCQKVLYRIEVVKRHALAGLSFARRASLDARFNELARLHFDIDIVARTDLCMEQRISPGTVSALCLRCKGDIPTASFAEHLERCLSIEPLPARSLGASVVPSRVHHRDDFCTDEDDWDSNAELIVCGYPSVYADIEIRRLDCRDSDTELPISTTFCSRAHNECIDHHGWHKILTAELAQLAMLQNRRLERLNAELELVRARIADRFSVLQRSFVSSSTSAAAPNPAVVS